MQTNWQPSASLETLRQRAKILANIRQFFAEHQIMEVETPLLCSTSVTDPFIQSIPVLVDNQSHKHEHCYLQTSPEYAMKRLLAAGSGPIYQISKAFRREESGRFHNPEFTMLEWYRLEFDHHDLMNEVDDFLQSVINTEKALRISYTELFQNFLKFTPHQVSLNELKTCAEEKNLTIATDAIDKDTWLKLLMSHLIEPQLGNNNQPCFVYDFPASQAALSRIRDGNPPLASRFEVYLEGVELANGFHELQDADEQRKRFENNLNVRHNLGLNTLPIDEYFLAALHHGLPDCAGVALGVDRLMMLGIKIDHISQVLSFDSKRV